jgi:hypothetical protein
MYANERSVRMVKWIGMLDGRISRLHDVEEGICCMCMLWGMGRTPFWRLDSARAWNEHGRVERRFIPHNSFNQFPTLRPKSRIFRIRPTFAMDTRKDP